MKGKKEELIEKNVQYKFKKRKSIVLVCNGKEWFTEEIMKKFNDSIWEFYINRHIFNMSLA